ncbi:M56 family metallopeptidase, partial [Pseudomonas sp. CGJS7]|uniref:M56 family metallopeptidase n=1 Tax=Pseudomonas sp. CGJS7 TaxID=3109348 RepID=UPI003008AC17
MSLQWIGETLLPRLFAAGLQSLLVVAAVWALCRYVRLSPSLRCWLWWFASLQLLVGALWPTPLRLPVLPVAWDQAALAAPAAPQLSASAQLPFFATRGDLAASAVGESVAVSVPASALDWLSWPLAFAALWLSGFLLIAVASARGYASARRRIAQAQPCDQPWVLQAYRALGDSLGLTRLPPLRLSAQIDSPQLIGPWPDAVLLPRERLAQFSGEELAMALHHELVHVRRRDLWWGWVPALVQHLFFFHPLAHVIAREYSIAREAACDADVLASRRYAAQDYGRLLLRLGVAPRPAAGVASASPTYTSLKRRLTMLQNSTSSSHLGGLVLTAAVVLLGLVPYRVTAAAADAAPKTRTSTVSIHSSNKQDGETRITELVNGGKPLVWAVKGDNYYRVGDDGRYQPVQDAATLTRLKQRMSDARQADRDAQQAARDAEQAGI